MALFVSDRIFYGVTIQNIAVGGLTQSQAREKLEAMYQTTLNHQALIRLTTQDKKYTFSPADIELTIDFDATAHQAYLIGRSHNPLQSLLERLNSAQRGIDLPFILSYNTSLLQASIYQISLETMKQKSDAKIECNNNEIQIIPEVIGQRIDTEKLFQTIDENLLTLKVPIHLELPLETDMPTVTQKDLAEIDTVLSVYTSNFNAANRNRSENIRIAANSINNLLMQSAQVISFNTIVGPRIAEAGFKEAPVIIEGKSVPDIGGGVCQVSSTLYNAILLADMEPIERTPHFHPLGYVPIGLDATVADNLLDFKYQNTLSKPTYIIAKIQDGALTIMILGNKADLRPESIQLSSTIDKIIPPQTVIQYDKNIPSGKRVISEAGQPGYIVSSYRLKFIDGKEVAKELLYVDQYTPEDQVITLGTNLK